MKKRSRCQICISSGLSLADSYPAYYFKLGSANVRFHGRLELAQTFFSILLIIIPIFNLYYTNNIVYNVKQYFT
jgi:hypothetical protein